MGGQAIQRAMCQHTSPSCLPGTPCIWPPHFHLLPAAPCLPQLQHLQIGEKIQQRDVYMASGQAAKGASTIRNRDRSRQGMARHSAACGLQGAALVALQACAKLCREPAPAGNAHARGLRAQEHSRRRYRCSPGGSSRSRPASSRSAASRAAASPRSMPPTSASSKSLCHSAENWPRASASRDVVPSVPGTR